jgi:hypothetical protein
MGVGIFLLFGTLMAFLAGTTLVWPGTALDHAWALNPRAHRGLAPFGWMIGIPFLLLGATLLTAAVAVAGRSARYSGVPSAAASTIVRQSRNEISERKL